MYISNDLLRFIYYNYLLYELMMIRLLYFEEDNPFFPSFILENQDIYLA